MFSDRKVKPGAVVWTGSVASGLISGPLCQSVRPRIATRPPRTVIMTSCPLRSSPGSPLSFKRVLSVVLVRRFCRTARSVPQMTSLLLSASFIAWRWALFGWSRRERPPRLMWTRFVRLFFRSLRLRVRVGQGFVLRTSAMRYALPASPASL